MKMKPLILLCLAAFCSRISAAEPAFTLKNNDTWVMAGDSITAQRLHTNYIEAFYRTRYPQLHLHFRNSGISGNRTGSILDRFDYDVAAWKPTIVSIELGMNDVGGTKPDDKNCAAGYIAGMKKLADSIRALNARPIFISSSPVNDGSIMNAWVGDRCHSIHPFTNALIELGQTENVLTVDQYHPLLALWGPNKTLDDANALAAHIRLLKPEHNIPDLKTLQAFAKSWEGKPAAFQLTGDDVHVGPAGQYTMAATILAALNVDREVSSATIKADGTVVDAKSCKITEAVSKNGVLSFTRLDARSPWPLGGSGAAPALMPEIADLSRYMLTVSGLSPATYVVTMDGKPVATLSDKELAKGWNMGAVTDGPLGDRSRQILSLINDLQNPLNAAWRAASKDKDAVKLAEAQKAIDACEAKVQDAVQPTAIHFEIAPSKAPAK